MRLLSHVGIWGQLLAIVVIYVVIGNLIYSNTYKVPFIFDDVNAIENNVARHSISLHPKSFLSTRSIPFFTFDLNYAMFGVKETKGWHLTNIQLHVANSIVVFFLIYALLAVRFKKKVYELGLIDVSPQLVMAFLVGLLHLTHPVHTQAVTYTVQRIASLATFFYLFSLLGYVQFRRARQMLPTLGWAAVSLAAAVFAMHSKEISITLPAAIVLLEFTFFSRDFRALMGRIPKLLPWLVMFFIIPFYLMGWNQFLTGDWGADDISTAVSLETFDDATSETHKIEFSRAQYLFTQFIVIRIYLRLLFLPINQTLDYDIDAVESFFRADVIGGLLVELALVALAIGLFRIRWRMAGAGILFFFLALAPESSIFPIVDLIFEHRVYLPFFGFSMVVAEVLMRLWRGVNYGALERTPLKFVLIGLVLLWFGVLGYMSYQRNFVWKSQVSLWQDVVAKAPDKPRPHNNLGLYYFGAGEDQKAKREFEIALELDNDYAEANNNMGMILIRMDKLEEAEYHLHRAIELKENYSHAYNNLGAIHMNRGNLDEAEVAFRRALDIEPRYSGARDNLGMVLVHKNQLEEAEEHLMLNIEQFPDFVGSYVNLGVVYHRTGRTLQAIDQFRKVLEIQPNNALARRNLQLLQQGQVAGAGSGVQVVP